MIVSLLRKLTACIPIFIAVILLALLVLMVIFSITVTDPVIRSLPSYDDYEMYTEGGFGDFTDYGIYHYSHADLSEVRRNTYLSPIGDNLDNLLSYIDHYEGITAMLQSQNEAEFDEIVTNYHFDRSVIDKDDYLYIKTKEGTPIGSNSSYGKFDNYSLYIFDIQSKKLYYFHTNI